VVIRIVQCHAKPTLYICTYSTHRDRLNDNGQRIGSQSEIDEKPKLASVPRVATLRNNVRSSRIEPQGLEPCPDSTGKTHNLEMSAAKSGACSAPEAEIKPGLRAVIDAWPNLSEDDRQAIFSIVRNEKSC